MACFHPLKAERLPLGQIVFYSTSAGSAWTGKGKPLDIPCGQCVGCRLEKSRQWAMRCVHEASLHDDNCFITLTYNPENMPPDGGLIKRDFVNFMKRLRKSISPRKIKFYMCGEYGDKSNRPHYHAVIFGYNFPDWIYLFDSPGGEPIYTSPTLEKLWSYGFVTIGTVTFESAAYVARYVMKKINGPLADKINEDTGLRHYERFNDFTGEIHEVLPEYSTMSRGGKNGHGIAHDWIRKYINDCYPKDFTTIRGVRMRPPRYYDKYIEGIDPVMYDDIKAGRELTLLKTIDDNTELRLSSREKVKEAQFKQLVRSL